jgi:3D (Asp-Asp-Asp) domain-containing protein
MKENLTKYSKGIAQTAAALTIAAGMYLHKDANDSQVLTDEKDNSPPIARHIESSFLNFKLSPLEFYRRIPPEKIDITQEPTEIQINRQDCGIIKGTPYESVTEREWYLANCKELAVTKTPVKTGSGKSPVTWYYCAQVPGYSIGDGGGYCKGEGKSGVTAACGEKWQRGSTLLIEGYETPVVCDDRGKLTYDQVDVYFSTNQEAVNSGLPTLANITQVR